MTVSSTFTFTDPVRMFKANDPFYWELLNIPIQQLQDNTRWLKDQVDSSIQNSSTSRSGFAELKPYCNETDNTIRVLPGRYSARVNDAYSKTPLQRLRLTFGQYSSGQFRSYLSTLSNQEYDTLISRIWTESSANALGLNGLLERTLTWRVANPDQHIPTNTTAFGNLPSTGAVPDTDKSPVVFSQPFVKGFVQYPFFSDLNRLSAEFCKQWRGVSRIAIVDVPDELTLEVPSFDPADFKVRDSNGQLIDAPNTTHRIDLVFIYTHPVDVSSTTIIKYSGGSPQTITSPILGMIKGAGAVLASSTPVGGAGTGNTTHNVLKSIDANGNLQILASPADQQNSNLGFKGLNIHGSFPSPDDLLNIAPNLIETLEENNLQLIGQSILPICYIVTRRNASVNSFGQNIILTQDIIDIRPFFRTAELTYNERAGISAASPPISFANPAVGQTQLDYQCNLLKSDILTVIDNSVQNKPRTVAGGTIWGGTAYGPEGAIRLAAQLLNGVNISNLPFSQAPQNPDWDIAEWWNMYSFDGVNITFGSGGSFDDSGPGAFRNDWINVTRKNATTKFDSGTSPTNPNDISTASRWLGTQAFSNAGGNPVCFYWVKKTILIDRSAVPWMQDYTVECQLQNCLPQTHKASRAVNKAHDDESGVAGIWVERKFDRFTIYVAWLATSIASYSQDDLTVSPSTREPRLNRSSELYSGFVVRHSDMGLPSVNNMPYDFLSAGPASKTPNVGTCTYPTVSFKVTGFPSSFYYESLAQYPQLALVQLK
jgi:hypothetical protein